MTKIDSKYHLDHANVRAARGKASMQDCIDCGKFALDWSHRHDTDPSDPNNYDPRCRSCHNKYDGPRGGAKIGNNNAYGNQNRLGHTNTAEHNAKLSQTRIDKYGIPDEIIVCVRAMHASGMSQRYIANHFNISTATVGRIVRYEKRFA